MLWGREEGATDGAGGAEYEGGRVGVEGWVAVVMMEIAGAVRVRAWESYGVCTGPKLAETLNAAGLGWGRGGTSWTRTGGGHRGDGPCVSGQSGVKGRDAGLVGAGEEGEKGRVTWGGERGSFD